MPIRVNYQPLERLSEFLREVSGRYSVQVEGLTQPSQFKATMLTATGRPFFAVTPALRNAVLQEWKRNASKLLSKSGNALNLDPALRIMGDAIKRAVIRRFDDQGGDVHLRPLSAGYLRWKLQHGLDRRIGIATGVLYRNIQRARFTLRKVGA